MYKVMAGWRSENDVRDTGVSFEKKNDAIKRLDNAFERIEANLWRDTLKQEFWIEEEK